MGNTLIKIMTSALACEVGLKAILATRLNTFPKTHNLMRLYLELPTDCCERVTGDFPTIAGVLDQSQETFGTWRYFEPRIGGLAIRALCDTERAQSLSKAARVIADECEVVGLDFNLSVDVTTDVEGTPGNLSCTQLIHLTLHAGESAIPWEEILRTGNF